MSGPTAQLIAAAAALPSQPSLAERGLTAKLSTLAERLAEHRFQLAVVGQFKRGKSSLLNALLGQDALPTGVLPLTALPTFVRSGVEFALDVTMSEGASERFRPASAHALREALSEFVSEQANPANVKGVQRVEITLPSPLLEVGLVLIDTPGIGSTVSHNTEVAEAALPECDAALMVLSPEPPITQAELDYLAKVRAHAAKLIVAFNKVDSGSEPDIEATLGYLRSELEAAGAGDVEIFPVSARNALAAMAADDDGGLVASGVPALLQRLTRMARSEGQRILTEAVCRKAAAIGRDLSFENDLTLAALIAPAEDLDRRIREFDRATLAFDRERQATADRIGGDRRRLLQLLDEQAAGLAAGLKQELATAVGEERGASGPGLAWERVRATIPERLTRLQPAFVQRQRKALEAALTDHQARASALLDDLRRTTADLMQVAYQAPSAIDAFVVKAEPYWTDRPRESLADAPAGLLEKLAPGELGRRLARRRIESEIDQLATTNVEHLRWACRLNIEDSLRSFGSEIDGVLSEGVSAITDGLAAAARMRQRGDEAARETITQRRAWAVRLRKMIAALDPVSIKAAED
jgi:GTP-binding protein EngB required for normal cell division